MYIVVAILIFGILIIIHELGHFIAAKRFGVKVNEFAFGMGPKLWSFKRGETVYALRLLPIGGACVMEGEDEDNPDPRAFNAQKRWKRVIILAAGAFMNFLFGLIVVLLLNIGTARIVDTTLVGFQPDFPGQGAGGLMVGDTIHSINGERTYYVNDFSLFMDMPAAKDGVVDLVVMRDGEKVKLPDFELGLREYMIDGELQMRYGVVFQAVEPTFGARLNYSLYTAMNYVRLVRVGLVQLIGGDVSVTEMAGPVGIVATINESAHDPYYKTVKERLASVFNIGAFIAMNLAVMNLLPIPALDGGRIFGIVVTFIIEKITRRRVNPKYEGYIHAGGLALLLVFAVVIMVSDIIKLF